MEGLAAVRQSYGRCCLNPKFIDLFYDHFLKSHPAIKPMFANTDFSRQKELLKTGIAMLLSFVEGKAAGEMTMKRIAESHSKQHLNIDPNLYQYWINSLLTAVKESDRKCDVDILRNWEKVLRTGVDYITSHYDAARA